MRRECAKSCCLKLPGGVARWEGKSGMKRGVEIKTGDMMFWWAPKGRSWTDGWAWVEGEGVVVLLVLHSKPIQSTPPGMYTEADSSAGDEARRRGQVVSGVQELHTRGAPLLSKRKQCSVLVRRSWCVQERIGWR